MMPNSTNTSSIKKMGKVRKLRPKNLKLPIFRKVLLVISTPSPLEMINAKPRMIDCIATVAIKDDILSCVTQNAMTAPKTAPAATTVRMVTPAGKPCCSSSAAMTPEKAAVEPTERSMWLPINKSASPTVIRPVSEAEVKTLIKFLDVK